MNKCPQCREKLQFVAGPDSGKWVCTHCQREYQKGHYPLLSELKTAQPKAIVQKRKSRRMKNSFGDHRPFVWWEYVAAFFGIPIDLDEKQAKASKATACALLVSAILLVSFFAFGKKGVFENWGLLPDRVWQKGGLTFLTQFFIHVDLWHLLGNVYFLLVFGEAVEHKFGHTRFLMLVLLATLFGNIIHLFVANSSHLPLVGASGGVAGVMIFYAFSFPKKDLGVLFLFQWVRVPAHLYVAFWLIYQVMGAVDQIQNLSPVSYIAHLGGGLMGYLLWRLWKNNKMGALSD